MNQRVSTSNQSTPTASQGHRRLLQKFRELIGSASPSNLLHPPPQARGQKGCSTTARPSGNCSEKYFRVRCCSKCRAASCIWFHGCTFDTPPSLLFMWNSFESAMCPPSADPYAAAATNNDSSTCSLITSTTSYWCKVRAVFSFQENGSSM